MNTFWQDVRYGQRMLLKNRGFTLVALLTLALGLGANLTIFSFVDTFFLRPLPVQKPYQLATVTATRNGELVWGYIYPEYAYLRDHRSVGSWQLELKIGNVNHGNIIQRHSLWHPEFIEASGPNNHCHSHAGDRHRR